MFCDYSLTPFVVTIYNITNQFSSSIENTINITTEYLDHNGIHYPANQGKYLLEVEITSEDELTRYERVQQYIDILPGKVDYFKVSYAHRDINKHNIFTVEFRTGSDVVPAYNHGTTSGRIYIGFPTKDSNGANVFSDDLGFNTGLGTVLPCWFKSGLGYASAVSGEELKCVLRNSPYSPKEVWV